MTLFIGNCGGRARCSYCKSLIRVYKTGKYAGRLVGHKSLSHVSLSTGSFISRRCTGSLQTPRIKP